MINENYINIGIRQLPYNDIHKKTSNHGSQSWNNYQQKYSGENETEKRRMVRSFHKENKMNPLCKCKCGEKIEIKKHHKWAGIPKYIRGHHVKGKKLSKQHKQNISKSNIGKKATAETRKKLSEFAKTRIGDKNPFFGKHHTKKTLKKLRLPRPHTRGKNNYMYGKKHTEETLEKMRKPKPSIRGDNHYMKNPVIVKKIVRRNRKNGVYKKRSEQMKGSKNHFYGKKHPEETLKKMTGRIVSKENKEKVGDFRRGKTYEQMYGIKRAKQLKKICSVNGNREWFKQKMRDLNLGKTLQQMYGKEKAEEIRAKRRLNMLNRPHIHYENNPIEVKLQEALQKEDIVFETHKRIMGRPDFFIQPNVAGFVDGCYWHYCPDCMQKQKKKLYPWQMKNIKRDKQVNKWLKENDYVVIRLWEHSINNDIDNCVQQIMEVI